MAASLGIPLLAASGCVALAFREPAPPPAPPAPSLPNPNGFDALVRAASRVTRGEEAATTLTGRAKDGKPARFTPEQKRDIVAANRPALGAMRGSLRLGYRKPAPPVRDIERPLPHYPKIRSLVRVACLDGQVRWDAGDRAGGVDAFVDAVEAGRRVPSGAPLIGRLVGIACETIGRRQIWVRLDQMDVPTARGALTRVTGLENQRSPLAETMEEERLYGRDGLRKAFRDPESVLGEPEEGDTPEARADLKRTARIVTAVTILQHGKAGILRNYDAALDRYVAAASEPFARHPEELDLPEDRMSSVMVEGTLHKAWVKDAANGAFDALLRVALALRLHRLERGAYPDDLSALASRGYLGSLPADPFSADGKAPPVYRRTPGKDAYLLYSLGPDCRDDGGKAIQGKSSKTGKPSRAVEFDSVGDIVAGVQQY